MRPGQSPFDPRKNPEQALRLAESMRVQGESKEQQALDREGLGGGGSRAEGVPHGVLDENEDGRPHCNYRRCPRARPLCHLRLVVDGADRRPSCLAYVRSGPGVGNGKGRDREPRPRGDGGRGRYLVVPEFQSISPWVWVRPDLNRSRQHPKLVGFPVGRMTRGPRAQTKLPHGPAGRLEGLRR